MATTIFAHEPGGIDYQPGEVIFREGDAASSMFFVQSAEVDLLVGQQLVEPSVLTGFSASWVCLNRRPDQPIAVARTVCRVVEVNQLTFTRQVSRNPFFAIEMMRTFSSRLRNANSSLASQS